MKSFVFGCGLFLISCIAYGKTLYVDVNAGNDSVTYANNGPGTPWATIGRAAWGNVNRASQNSEEAAQAGDTVIVRSGAYVATQGVGERYIPIYNPVNSGVQGAPIIFQAEDNVILTSNTSTSGEPLIGAQRRNYIIWDGFIIDEVNSNTTADTGPVVIWSSDNIIIRNIIVQGKTVPWNDNHNAIRIESSTNSTVQNNTLYGIRNAGGNRNASAIMLYYCENILIENNEIYDSDGGIFVKGANPGPVTIRYNLLYDLGSEGVAFGGIGTSMAQNGAHVYQNVIRDSASGVTFIGYDSYSPANVYVVNNTIDNTSLGGFFFRPNTAGYSNLVFKNNLVSNSLRAIQGEDISDISSMEFSHNLYFNNTIHARINYSDSSFQAWRSAYNKDTVASSEQDPLLASVSYNDFRPTFSSPAINAGVDVLNLQGNGNTAPITIGAHISSATKIGPVKPAVRHSAPTLDQP